GPFSSVRLLQFADPDDGWLRRAGAEKPRGESDRRIRGSVRTARIRCRHRPAFWARFAAFRANRIQRASTDRALSGGYELSVPDGEPARQYADRAGSDASDHDGRSRGRGSPAELHAAETRAG